MDSTSVWTRRCNLGIGLFRPRDGLRVLTLTTRHAFTAPRSRPHALPLKSLFVSPQARLLKTPGSPILTASSCQDNSIRDTSPVGPSLGTTPSPEMHITVYRTISPLSVRSISPFALDSYSPLYTFLSYLSFHCRSNVAAPCHRALAVMRIELIRVLVFNPLAWPRPGGRIYSPVPPFSLRLRAIAVSFSLRPLRIPQPCR